MLCDWCSRLLWPCWAHMDPRDAGEQGAPLTRDPSTNPYGAVSLDVGEPLRAFVIARHPAHGYLVLKAFKNRKGLHGQLPGGKIDSSDASPMAAAARELFEETGIDVRGNLERLSLASFPDGTTSLKRRQYFRLELRDEDQSSAPGSKASDSGEPYRLQISSEHVGFLFERDALRAAEQVAMHSGGKNTQALIHLEGGR